MTIGANEPLAVLVVAPGTAEERAVPIHDRLFVGRECDGVDEQRRLLIDEPAVSRHHLEIRLEPGQGRACLVDTSTNGTRLNGARVERAVPVPLVHGARLTVGSVDLEFRSEHFTEGGTLDRNRTVSRISRSQMVMAVGDIANYSTISQYTDSQVVLGALEVLYEQLRDVVAQYQGTVINYVGDALFAAWEFAGDPAKAELGVCFSLAAVDRVQDLAGDLPLRTPEDDPIRMGWAVVLGDAAVSSLTRAVVAVVGDATNLAFRLSGLAARAGRADVVVTQAVHDLLGGQFGFTEAEQVEVKGRTGAETIFGVTGPKAVPGPPAR